MAEFLVITGLGGAGRTHAAHTLEDLGWFVIDNLPASLLSKVVELAVAPGSTYHKVALVVGYASRPVELLEEVKKLDSSTGPARLLFLHASTEALVNRYESTRRRHPAGDQGVGLAAAIEAERTRAAVPSWPWTKDRTVPPRRQRGLAAAIEAERASMEPILAAADVVIDTTNLSVHDLARRVAEVCGSADSRATHVSVTSFGYSKGVPRDADLVIDCRYLPNPHWVPELRPLTGLDDPIRAYLSEQPIMQQAIDRLEEWLSIVLPAYAAEGRAYFNIAFGCTGGQHRSVAMAEIIGAWLRSIDIDAVIHHRELGR